MKESELTNMSKIPSDLQKYTSNHILKRALLFFALEMSLIFILVMWGEDILGVEKSELRDLLYALVLLIPPFVSGFPFVRLDKTYFGVIERAEIQTSFENERPWHPTLEGQYTATKVILTVKEEDSDKRHTVKVQEKGGAHEKKGMWDAYSQRPDGSFVQNAEVRYREGARVFHLGGTKQWVVLPTESDESVRCAVCGDHNAIEQATCRKCGHTLMKE